MSVSLADSYRYCERLARQSASNFYYSFLMLPHAKRWSMCALYAFLRRADDLGDSQEPLECRRAALAQWRESFSAALSSRYDDPLLPALADTVHRYQVPVKYLYDAITGVEMDLDGRRYETFAELEDYCYHVASAVGMACIYVWGFAERAALEPARQCGVAFQLTNILRDLKEDALVDRIYLPREDLRRFGYTAEDLRAGICDERLRRLVRFEVERCEQYYAGAAELGRWLSPDGRRILGTMIATYRGLLDEIRRLDGDVFSARIRLSGWRKLRIATRWLLFQRRAARPYAIGVAGR